MYPWLWLAVASYGRQLGLITEVLVAEHAGITSPAAATSLERLKRIRDRIEEIKRAEYARRAADIEAEVAELKRRGGVEYTKLAEGLSRLLREDT